MSLTTKGHFKIGNTEFVASAIRPIFDSLADENSGRDDNGVMHIYWKRPKMRKWEITMPPMTSTQAAALINLIQGKTYTLTIWDISANAEVNVNVYTSNSAADMYSGVIMNGLWRGFKFSAIEM